jgi:hypothetical protein
MANPVKGEVELTLSDGREFLLVADRSALVKAAQELYGATKINRLLHEMQPELDKDKKVKVDEYGDPVKDTMPATAAFLFGMFDAHHPDVTLRDAKNMLLDDPEVVTEAIGLAVERGFPDEVAEGKKGGNPPPKPHAKISGRSGVK